MSSTRGRICNNPFPVKLDNNAMRSLQERLMNWLFICFGILHACALAAVVDSSAATFKDAWYTRYKAYPPYCASPSEMEKRPVPSLNSSDKSYGDSRLVHVTAIIRHGARTPLVSGYNCWDGYNDNPDTAVWNCSLTTFVAAPPPNLIYLQEQASTGQPVLVDYANPMFLFEKHYTALMHPEYNLANQLKGSCQRGQLLSQGYEQQLSNGGNLRKAYIYDGSRHDHNQRMKLMDVTDLSSMPSAGSSTTHIWSDAYFRVDDDQRTVMSGQVLLSGMFGPELVQYYTKNQHFPIIPMYLADRNRDVLAPDETLCPRLKEIRERHLNSLEFRAFNESAEALAIRKFHRVVLKIDHDMDAVDCLMTTICTDRPLPDEINDYTGPPTGDDDGTRRRQRQMQHETSGEGTIAPSAEASSPTNSHIPSPFPESMFDRLFTFNAMTNNIPMLANDAEYSKLGIGPLWGEIMVNIQAFLKQQETVCCPTIRKPPKFALFSGHDSTIIPILASLGPRVYDKRTWPDYASMILIEIHDINIDGQKNSKMFKSDFAFRLIYNGKVITSLVDGCPTNSQLCDANVLIDRVQPFAILNRNCALQHSSGPTTTTHPANVPGGGKGDDMSSTTGFVAFTFVILASAFFGAMTTYACLSGDAWGRTRYTSAAHDDGPGFSNGSVSYSDDLPRSHDFDRPVDNYSNELRLTLSYN